MMNTYHILLGPIVDGAGIHKDGGIISLAEAEAAPLLELGIIEPVPESEPAPVSNKKPGKTPPAAD
jgi:hypothetical protein